MMEHGLVDSSHYRPKSSTSDDLSLVESVSGADEFVSVSVTDLAAASAEAEQEAPPTGGGGDSSHLLKPPSRPSPDSSESDWETLDPSVLEEAGPKEAEAREAGPELQDAFDSQPGTPITVQPQAAGGQGVSQGLVSGLEEDQYGLPLPIFTKVRLTAGQQLQLESVNLNFIDVENFRQSYRTHTAPPGSHVDLCPSLPGLPVSALHGAAAASPPVRRDRARLRCRGDQHPVPPAETPERRHHRRESTVKSSSWNL